MNDNTIFIDIIISQCNSQTYEKTGKRRIGRIANVSINFRVIQFLLKIMLKFTTLLSDEFRRSPSITILKNRTKSQYESSQDRLYSSGTRKRQNQEQYYQTEAHQNRQRQQRRQLADRYYSSTRLQTPPREHQSLRKMPEHTCQKHHHERKFTITRNFPENQYAQHMQTEKSYQHKPIQKKKQSKATVFTELSYNDINLRLANNYQKLDKQKSIRNYDTIHQERRLQLDPKKRAFHINTLESIQNKIKVSLDNNRLKI